MNDQPFRTRARRRGPSSSRPKLAVIAAVLAGTMAVAACGGSSKSGSTPTAVDSGVVPVRVTTAATAVAISSFTRDFSAMSRLRAVVAQGRGKIGVILPDMVSSDRYVEFDAPYLTEAFETAGLGLADFSVDNAQGSDAQQLAEARADLAAGATVLVVDPIDSAVGVAIEKAAQAKRVPVIDYGRLTLGGSRQYYVSFDSTEVGTLLGEGVVSCAAAWGVAKPNVIVMNGASSDHNAVLSADAYNSVLAPYFATGGWVEATQTAGTWDPQTTLAEFRQAFAAHPGVNAALTPNGTVAAPIIGYLKSLHVAPRTFPITGQDATLVGLQNVLSGYQCGSVYKPIFVEAQAAAALAIYQRDGVTPPTGLINGGVTDTIDNTSVPSVLLTPQWIPAATIEATVVKDQFVSVTQLCAGAYAPACQAAGIS